MPFRPSVNSFLNIQSISFHFVEHPSAPGIPYGQTGRRAKVFCVQNDAGNLYALKMFFHEFRSSQVEQSAYNLGQFAQIPGLSVCARTVLTPQSDTALLQQNPDLLYAVLMPWVVGKTWYEAIYERLGLSPRQSFHFANALARILADLEHLGAAHCDISSGNVMLPGLLGKHPRVALVDVEEMFAPGFNPPAKLPAGTPGYNHKTAARGLWSADADCFAGAVLLAELLGWCDPGVRNAAAGGAAQPGEQYFEPVDMQKPGERYDILAQSLRKSWGENVSNLFERAWWSETLSDCASFTEWKSALSGLESRASQLDELAAPAPSSASPIKGWRAVAPSASGNSLQSQPVSGAGGAFLPSGFLLNGRYEIQEQLGDGGFGTVYLAVDRQTRLRCAVKANRENSPESARQFSSEALILRSLSHPNLARVYDYLDIPGLGQYIIMEFIAGETLHALGKRVGPLRQDQLLAWAGEICDALDYLHHQVPPVIHRDVKPANIIIDAHQRPRLVDFGVAKATMLGIRTQTSARAHTPGFSPPEQYGSEPTDARSDIYSLGATFYALLTGKTPPESVARLGGKSLPLIRACNSTIGPQVETAIERAMSLDVNQRFQTAAGFKSALFTPRVGNVTVPPVIPPPTIIYPPPTVPELAPQPGGSRWFIMAIGALLSGILCISAITAMWYLTNTGAATPTPQTGSLPLITQPETDKPLTRLPNTQSAVPVRTTSAPVNQPATTIIPTSKPFTNQWIAYAAGGSQSAKRNIYVKYLDGSQADTRITFGTDQYGDNYPTFSPDGRSLAFTRCYQQLSDGCELFTQSFSSGTPQRVLSGHKVMRPKWCGSVSSPYRDWVVFEDRRKNGNNYQDTDSSIGLVNTVTGEFRKLTTTFSDWFPSWSPDCSQVIFTRYSDSDTVGLYADLMVMDVESKSIRPLTGSGSFSPPAEASAAWSHDGRWIAYRELRDRTGDGKYRGADDRADLWLMQSSGANPFTLISNSYSIASLAWAGDSQSLVFTTQNNQMLVCDLEGNILFNFGGEFFHPTWSP